MTENETASSQPSLPESSYKILIRGVPSPRQKEFFASRARFTAYGGARGGGKSWALRRKLVALCIRYPGICCLLVRRTLPELRSNHVIPFLKEYGALLKYSDSERSLRFENGSCIYLGHLATDRDAMRYQGQEYDIIAIDEATQISEYRFSALKACLRGSRDFPRRMYLTCNPGGIGHSFVKRLFVDRIFKSDEDPSDYRFIPAKVFDNEALTSADPDYVSSLLSLPPRLRDAWLYGRWDVFEGQFFPEFDENVHVVRRGDMPMFSKTYVAFDYGFDMLAALLIGITEDGRLYVTDELAISGLTLSEAALQVSSLCKRSGIPPEFAVCSPDLWNRRQDSGRSGFEIMQRCDGMPPMTAADDRRVAGWRVLREYLSVHDHSPKLFISENCSELIRCLPALLYDKNRPEDASGEPHAITHAPEALRYAVMARAYPRDERDDLPLPFTFSDKKSRNFFD